MNTNTNNNAQAQELAAEKINGTQVMTTKEQIEKVLKLKGMFYAKTKNCHRFNGAITYNDVMIYKGAYDNILKITIECCDCSNDRVIDTQEFHLLEDGWHQVSVYGIDDGYYRTITDEDLTEMPWHWVSVRNADEDFRAYVNHLFTILK